jgi:two-component sensor histidine kinase
VTLHELATNAAKYGALSSPDGLVGLKWLHEADERLNLHWMERGGPAVLRPLRQGFGTRIIERMIDQLEGEASFDWHVDELICRIAFRRESQP